MGKTATYSAADQAEMEKPFIERRQQKERTVGSKYEAAVGPLIQELEDAVRNGDQAARSKARAGLRYVESQFEAEADHARAVALADAARERMLGDAKALAKGADYWANARALVETAPSTDALAVEVERRLALGEPVMALQALDAMRLAKLRVPDALALAVKAGLDAKLDHRIKAAKVEQAAHADHRAALIERLDTRILEGQIVRDLSIAAKANIKAKMVRHAADPAGYKQEIDLAPTGQQKLPAESS